MNDRDAHHLAKNILQNIISYINVMFARKETVHKSEINKLVRFVRNLASMHDFFRTVNRNGKDDELIKLDALLCNLFNLHPVEHQIRIDTLPSILCTTRRAVTVSLIMIELLDNASRYGESEISVHCEVSKPDMKAIISVRNNRASEPKKTAHPDGEPYGLALVEKLSQIDFGTDPVIQCTDTMYTVQISVPIEAEC